MYRTHRSLLGESLWRQLLDLGTAYSRPADSTLLRESQPGNHVLALHSGCTAISRIDTNHDPITLAIRGSGELLGDISVIRGQVRSATVTTITPCRAHVITASAFRGFVDSHGLTGTLMEHAFVRFQEAEEIRIEQATASHPARLAACLERLLDALTETDRPASIPLPQDRLARLVGVSRNTVVNIIKPWRASGWLRTDPSGGLTVVDLPAIRAAAGLPEQRSR